MDVLGDAVWLAAATLRDMMTALLWGGRCALITALLAGFGRAGHSRTMWRARIRAAIQSVAPETSVFSGHRPKISRRFRLNPGSPALQNHLSFHSCRAAWFWRTALFA